VNLHRRQEARKGRETEGSGAKRRAEDRRAKERDKGVGVGWRQGGGRIEKGSGWEEKRISREGKQRSRQSNSGKEVVTSPFLKPRVALLPSYGERKDRRNNEVQRRGGAREKGIDSVSEEK